MVIRGIILKVNLFWDLCMQTIENIPKNPGHVDNVPKRSENPDCNVQKVCPKFRHAPSELNDDLQLNNNWAYQWKMSFNPEPNKQAVEVLFSKRNKSPVHPPIFFNGIEVTRVDEHKHLGLNVDPKLTFEKHIISKSKVARKNIGILKHLYPYIPLTTLDQLYKIYIRSRLDYCDIIFHVPPLSNFLMLQ